MRHLIQRLVTLSLISLLFSVSFMFSSVMAWKPPTIVSVKRSPETPNYDQPVKITVQVETGNADIKSVILSYRINDASWIDVTMSLDDGGDEDDWWDDWWDWWDFWDFWDFWDNDDDDNKDYADYVAEIPPQPCYTIVTYKVCVLDVNGNSAVSELFSYVVGDFVPPLISDILQVPNSPVPYETVTISATVTEPPEASGVKDVILWYTTDAVWSFIGMTMQGELVTATIPGQSGGVKVKYFVEAFDNEDNRAATSIFDYTVTLLNQPPVAVFTESASTVYTGEVIYFDASESYDPDGYITSYFWDFDDGTTATGVTVQHAYSQDGTYTVTLTVTDDDGATDTASATKTVLKPGENQSPIALFTESAETVYTGESISFDASGSHDPDGTIVSYHWDFGDGTTATGVKVSHAYVDDGSYTVTLTVTDNEGATGLAKATKTVLNRQPVASFTESAETVYIGESIFFDASGSYDPDGSIVSYHWDFGDGTTRTGVSVLHAYSKYGTYTVTLTVTDDDGATDSVSATKTVLTGVVVNQKPIAAFTESAETVYTGESISFDASGSYDPDGYIVGYFWDFGDGTTATGVSVSHAYADDGSYTVALTVIDNEGAIGSAYSTKTVLNRQPVASFTESAETVYIDESISFDASGSYDPDGYIVGYFWDFGDGTNATSVSVQHSYSQHGTYTVTLTVTDNDGATDSASATKTVLKPGVNQSPIALFTESAETVYIGESISFNASGSYDPDGTIVTYFWDFGDETNATGVTVQHSYSQSGTYTVTLTVTDDDGAKDTANATKTVLKPSENQKPIAIFTESAKTVYVNNVITFNAAQSYDPDGTIVSYHWDFGDGNTATGVKVSHAYANDGSYTVTLTVTDNKGATGSAQATKTVLNRQPEASFTASAETVYTGEGISFDASESYDPDGSIVSYHWDFGDGTTGSGVSVQHAYSQHKTYKVTLTVTDDDGATDTASATTTVLARAIVNRNPIASFTESAETVSSGETIHFDASGSYDSDGTIISHLWDFGDGVTAVGVEVNHAYEDDGIYTVTLTVIDNDGATGSTTSKKNVSNRPPLALFTENATTVTKGEVIHFDASGSYDPDGSIVSYHWDFGDGNTTTGVTSNHAYSEDGNYTVTLTVTDDDGASSTESAMKIVETETTNGVLSLSILVPIILGVMVLTATLLYGLTRRRKRKPKKSFKKV